jgi:hypothetical protein
MLETKNFLAVQFLLDRNANPHVEDMHREDCCDVAKALGIH